MRNPGDRRSALRLGARQIGFHDAQRVLHQAFLPGAERRARLDQAAQHTDVVGQADRRRADQYTVTGNDTSSNT